MESKDVSKVDETLLDQVEADVYWCLTKLLDNIQVRRGEHHFVVMMLMAVLMLGVLQKNLSWQRGRRISPSLSFSLPPRS